MWRKCLLSIALMMLSAPMAFAGIGQADGSGVYVPDWVPGPNPQAPVTGDNTGIVSRAYEAIDASVGIPTEVKERLLSQVGAVSGQSGRPEATQTWPVIGLDVAAEVTEHANAVGNRPESVAGLKIAATKISQAAKDAISRVPIQWIVGQLITN